MPEPHYFSVKTPVFSSRKLKGVDPVLGPEMKSTGEILGLGVTLDEALQKALPFMEEQSDDEDYILCSISDRAKEESLPIIEELACNKFKIAATEGTAQFLQENGIMVEEIIKDSDQLNDIFS